MSHATPAVPYVAELKELDTQLNALAERTYGTLAAADQADIEEQLISVMTRACDFVRWVEDADPINAVHVVERIEELLNVGVDLAHSGEFRVDFLPSFAHEKPTLLADPIQHILPQGFANMTLKIISTLLSAEVPQAVTRIPAMQPGSIFGPSPWKKPLQPENATLASRFRRNIEMPLFKTHPLASKVFEARCEITHNQIHSPMRLALSPSGSCLVLTGTRGHSGRMPAMSIWRPNPDDDPGTFEHEEFEAELLGGIVHHSALDDARNLIVAADNERIKTYSWETRKGVHIMQSGNHRGPIAVLPNGRLARSGHGSAVVWNLDDLKAHEEGHGKLGSPPHTTVKLADNKYKPSQWHLHGPTSHILSNGGHRNNDSGTREYSCFLLDIEQGKKVSRFIGHGGEVSEFSTSAEDANAFATAASDGYARLYDVRHPLPQLTVDVENRQASCDAVAFAHLDGIPVLFTGGNRTECIKFWDLRAKKMVYELATGNNRVTSVRWDTNHAILYAATASRCIDHDGDFYGYRSFKRPNLQQGANNNSEESLKTRVAAFRARRNEERGSDGEEDDYRNEDGSLRGSDEEDGGDVNSDSDYDESKKWPSEAHHIESHFGCAFDAGGHRLYRYQFKENPDLDKWPHYNL